METRESKKDTNKLIIAVAILSFLLGCAVMAPKPTQEEPHQWEKCYCYDSFGRMLGHGSHCTVHGDGHECY